MRPPDGPPVYERLDDMWELVLFDDDRLYDCVRVIICEGCGRVNPDSPLDRTQFLYGVERWWCADCVARLD